MHEKSEKTATIEIANIIAGTFFDFNFTKVRVPNTQYIKYIANVTYMYGTSSFGNICTRSECFRSSDGSIKVMLDMQIVTIDGYSRDIAKTMNCCGSLFPKLGFGLESALHPVLTQPYPVVSKLRFPTLRGNWMVDNVGEFGDRACLVEMYEHIRRSFI